MSNRGKAGHRFDAASYRLADMIPYGHLLASTDPAGFLDRVADEIDALRDARKKRRDQMQRFFSAMSPCDKVGGVATLLKAWIAEDEQLLLTEKDT